MTHEGNMFTQMNESIVIVLTNTRQRLKTLVYNQLHIDS